MLREVLSDDVPILFQHTDLYATDSIAGVAVYLLAQAADLDSGPASHLGMVTVAGLRW